jgi:hypothetical protein
MKMTGGGVAARLRINPDRRALLIAGRAGTALPAANVIGWLANCPWVAARQLFVVARLQYQAAQRTHSGCPAPRPASAVVCVV